jgi:insertion element IS1 protein InsB
MKYTPILAQKNYYWVWIAVDRLGKKFSLFVLGDRSTQRGLQLWDKIKGIESQYYYSDHWASYTEFIPREKHRQSKAETYPVEGYNSRIRHYLTRFKRKGKCYTKSEHMLEESLNLLLLKLNNQLTPLS